MTITREQVERAIEGMRDDAGAWSVLPSALGEIPGAPWWCSSAASRWVGAVPADVRLAWQRGEWGACIAALTRWRDELVAAETPRKVAAYRGPAHAQRWDADPCYDGSPRYVLSAPYWRDDLMHPRWQYATTREQAIAWGYTIEGGPEPDHLAYADSPVWDDGPLPTPTPERPAPRFKEGDWVRDRDTVFRVAEMHWDDDRWYARPVAGVRDGIAEYSLQPAAPPAPDVVDVPQPIVKRCACSDIHDDVEATWQSGEPYLTVTHTTVPLALLRAMLAAIDAQQGGAS